MRHGGRRPVPRSRGPFGLTGLAGAGLVVLAGCGGGSAPVAQQPSPPVESSSETSTPDAPSPDSSSSEMTSSEAEGLEGTPESSAPPEGEMSPGEEGTSSGETPTPDYAPPSDGEPSPEGGEGPSSSDPNGLEGNGPTPAPPPPPVERDRGERALLALSTGHESTGWALAHEFVVTGPNDRVREMLDLVGWIPKTREPTLGLRWGMGITITVPRTVEGEYPVVGHSFGGQARPEGGTGFGPDRVDPATITLREPLARSGTFGKQIVAELETRRLRGDFGGLLRIVTSPGRRDLDADQWAEVERLGYDPGHLTGVAAPPPPPGPGAGDGSGMSSESYSGESSSPPPAAGPLDTSQLGPVDQVSPGVLDLGAGRAAELLALARRHGLHLLVVCEVDVTIDRRRVPIANTQARLYDVASGAVVSGTPPVDPIRVWQASQTKGGDDPIPPALERMFAKVDEYAVRPMPPLAPEHVATRIAALVKSPPAAKLPALTEIRYARLRGLIDDDAERAAFVAILGSEAEADAMLLGDESARREAVADARPDEVPPASAPSPEGDVSAETSGAAVP